ncbi:MAG: pyruvate, phosphate dikinase [Planctomycetota bacterium]
MKRSHHLVYSFANGVADGKATDLALLGSKGANLAEMTNLGIPVPPGFTISTEVCQHYTVERGRASTGCDLFPQGLWDAVDSAMSSLEQATLRRFGASDHPLLVSVRSGAAVSMPGMMDTILNLGLNEKTAEALAGESDNPRFAWDSYRRFVQMYGNVVLEVPMARFEDRLEQAMESAGASKDTDLGVDALRSLVTRYLETVVAETGSEFPTDPRTQLRGAIEAVLRSWDNERARVYRRINRIQDLRGTAVTVQAMVFGNTGEDSATGVCFTRNPSTGANEPFGEFLVNAQGEDVVAGVRTPLPLAKLCEVLPKAAEKLRDIMRSLERHFRQLQDLEFTIENGKLYILQTRGGKRTATAALKIAVDMVEEGLLSPGEAVLQVDANQLDQILHPTFDPGVERQLLASGIAASPGCVVGQVALSPERAEEWADQGRPVILIRRETSPEDLKGMAKSLGFVTARGGKTSHAAVVARQMGRTCVSGCSALVIDEAQGVFRFGDQKLREGDTISVDGTLGEIYRGELPTVQTELPQTLFQVMDWADDARQLRVRANAETKADCLTARSFGAEGLGLCRTEHMFFAEDRIQFVRQLILARSQDEKQQALTRLEPMQRGDFVEIFEVMDRLPVTIRLLDPPLHEFLPRDAKSQQAVADALGLPAADIAGRVDALHETNPMLGHRGCRLGITHPEFYDMQMRAILEAAIEVSKRNIEAVPEVMIPFSASDREFAFLKERLIRVAEQVANASGVEIPYLIGTMIEVPRAAITAGKIAEEADFFSFGTNDLTQMTFAISRDDGAGFLPDYYQLGLLAVDPFETIDHAGVGRLMEWAVDEGRKARSDLKIGICGESGGDPGSIEFCHRLGMDYVSCSPYRIPAARLAAAQAAVRARAQRVPVPERGGCTV